MPDQQPPKKKKEKKGWHVLLGGFLAGGVSRTLTAPLDRVKVLSQEGRIVNWAAARSHPTVHFIIDPSRRKLRLTSVVAHIYSEGGATAFWRGNWINCLKAGPELAVVFYLRQFFMKYADIAQSSFAGNFVCSAAAGAVAQCILYPLETTKTRIAVADSGEYRGILDCILQSYSRGGIRDFYKGLLANLLGIVPFRGLEVGTFYVMRSALLEFRRSSLEAEEEADAVVEGVAPPVKKKRADHELMTAFDVMALGGIASVAAQTVTYPLNVVRTRLQTQGVNGRPIIYSGMVDCARSIIVNDGVQGLFRGLMANYLKAVPASITTFVVVEQVQNYLYRHRW